MLVVVESRAFATAPTAAFADASADLRLEHERHAGSRPVMLDDETLRDGLQSPSVRSPTIDEKLRSCTSSTLGIDTADHRPARRRAARGPRRRASGARDRRSRGCDRANCAARTVIADIRPIVEISQRAGIAIECCTFIGSSPIRQYAEGWTLDQLLR